MVKILLHAKDKFLLIFIITSIIYSNEDLYKQIQSELILAQEGDVIQLPEGKFYLSRSLWGDNLNNIKIKGQGIDRTILSFENQIEGAEGIKIINSKNVYMEDFTIENSKGDLIKVEDSEGVYFKNIKAQWSYGPKETNGSYAFYPVKSKDVLLDNCTAIGASDAGIYVGQSNNIIVKNCTAFNNVAGIEIENSFNADVYNNYVYNNTGGILIFDLPDLMIKNGGNIRAFNNLVVENNLINFAPEGNIVAKVPSGTGFMILAASSIEIFDNIIYNNRTANTSIVSYFITEEDLTDELYNPYPSNIYIHNNIYKRDKQFPSFSFTMPIGFILAYNFGRDIPDIIYDGILDPDKINTSGQLNKEHRICIINNINAQMSNIDAGNDFLNISTDIEEFNCQHDSIKPITINN
jgi:parallel beta-helix repeat protein